MNIFKSAYPLVVGLRSNTVKRNKLLFLKRKWRGV